jgi:hypothetical protein
MPRLTPPSPRSGFSLGAILIFWISRITGQEHADSAYAIRLLPPHRERPRCRRAAKQRDELAPS